MAIKIPNSVLRNDVHTALTNVDFAISKKDLGLILNTYADVIIDHLTKGESVVLDAGLGTLEVRTRAARNGRNPQTGETITIPESKVVALKNSKALKDTLNP